MAEIEDTTNLDQQEVIVGGATRGQDLGHNAETDAVAKLYFVRLPRPATDDTLLKKLQQDFQSHVAEIKGINTRLAAKREIVRELRKQMSQARSLKDTSQPEFEEKLNRLKQLRDLRSGYLDKINAIKNNIKGLDFKTEGELDARIVELEEKIRFGSIPLREEKMVVNDISKLRGQREKIKEYELHKASLGELEAEAKKVKAVIEEMDGEFSIIKGERDAASGIIKDFWTQLKAAEAEAAKVEYEQKEAVDKKNEALEALEAARREVDGSMVDYRDNRKFSLQVRDLISSGQLEEAQGLCNKHTDEWMSKFCSDTVFRSEYSKAWADQRKFPVSELLPESSTSTVAAAAAKPPLGGKGAKAAAPAEKPVARGAEKAKDLIASLMLQASAEAARVKSGQQSSYDVSEDSEPDVEAAPTKPIVAAPAKLTAPAKLVSDPAAKAAEVFNFKVDLPQIEDVAFVLPTVAGSLAETRTKEQIREEQRLKAKEAEERKQRRLETTEKKRVKAAEYSKKSEEEERAAKVKASAAAASAAQQAKAAAAEAAAARAAAMEAEAAEAAAAASGSKEAVSYYGKPSPSLNASALKPAAAAVKRPAGKGSLLKKLKKFYLQNQTVIVVAAVALLILFILLFASLY